MGNLPGHSFAYKHDTDTSNIGPPPIFAQCKEHRPRALFRKGTVFTIISTYWFLLKYDPSIRVKDSKCHLMIPKSQIHVHYDEVLIDIAAPFYHSFHLLLSASSQLQCQVFMQKRHSVLRMTAVFITVEPLHNDTLIKFLQVDQEL